MISDAIKNRCNSHGIFIIYLIASVLFLTVQMFQGISFLDIGMYMSGYEHIADDPYPSVFLGQWLLSFVITSKILHLFHADGFLALRIMNLALITLTQCIVYGYAQKLIPKKYIVAGLGFTILSLYGAYTEINYNDYSFFLFLLAIISLHHGKENHPMFIGLSGAIIGISFYFRITNLAWLILPFIAWFIGYITHYSSKISTKQLMLYFYTGWGIGLVATFILLYLTGYSDLMVFTIKNMFGIGVDPKDNHNLLLVLIWFIEMHKNEIASTSAIAFYTMLIYLSLRTKVKSLRIGFCLILVGCIALCIYFLDSPTEITNGICILALVLCLKSKRINTNIKFLFALACTIPILGALGSNAEAAFANKGTCILAVPFALYTIAQAKNEYSVHKKGYNKSILVTLCVIGCAMLYANLQHTMMEEEKRKDCTYRINSPLTGNILTNKENAQMHNYLIKEVKPRIPKGSYLICNFSLTAISLLDCKPYAIFSTIYSGNRMNEKYINYAYSHTHKLPYILLKTETISERDSFVIEYLTKRHPYKTIWSDGSYRLLAPIASIPCLYID